MKPATGCRSIRGWSMILLVIALGATSPAGLADDPAGPASKPASLADVRQVMDWFAFPKPDGAQWEETGLLKTDYWVVGDFQKAAEFYRKALADQGWSENQAAFGESDKYRSMEFTKAGFLLALHQQAGTKQAYQVHLQNLGNVDAGKLPRPADAKVTAAGRSIAAYVTPSKPEAVVEFCRKELVGQGWRETPEHGIKSKESISLRFVQNAMECGVTIHLTPEGGTRMVLYHTRVRQQFEPAEVVAVFAGKDMPRPATAEEALRVLDLRKLPRLGEEKFVSKTGLQGQYETRASVAKAGTFYRKMLTEQGWVRVPPFVELEDRGALWFVKEGFHLSVETRDLIEEANKAGMVRIVLTNLGNVDLRQLPYPPGAEISCDTRNRRFTTSASKQEASAFYRQALTRLGWKEVKSVFLEFVQNDVKLVVIIHRPQKGVTPIEVYTKFGER